MLLVWSGSDKNSLSRLHKQYEEHLSSPLDRNDHESSYLKDLCYTLNSRRSLLEWRSFAVVETMEDLRSVVKKVSDPMQANRKRKLGFIFTGQGAQYKQMGMDLLIFPTFKNSLLKSHTYLQEFGCEWDIIGGSCLPFTTDYLANKMP
jgi:acyl transferase domain-containing protein